MKNTIKLIVIAVLLAGSMALRELPEVFAHDGHKKGHAPATAKRLRNPVEHNTANIENGKALYEANCAVCHGADGKGAEYNKKAKIKVPDLKSHYVMKLTDGEIFYVITNGIKTSGMPAYKLKASDRERWQLTHYVRHLGMSEEDHAAMTGDATQEVALRFKSVVGDKPFACGQSYEGICAHRNEYDRHATGLVPASGQHGLYAFRDKANDPDQVRFPESPGNFAHQLRP